MLGADNQQERPLDLRMKVLECGFEIQNRKSKIGGILRDYTPGIFKTEDEDIVRAAWRHAEVGRNDQPFNAS